MHNPRHSAARHYNASWGVPALSQAEGWLSVDPHADNYPNASPYCYVENNPIVRIDPDGRDWYESESGAVLWQKGDSVNIKINGEEFKNIGTTYTQNFNGLSIGYTQNEVTSLTSEGMDEGHENRRRGGSWWTRDGGNGEAGTTGNPDQSDNLDLGIIPSSPFTSLYKQIYGGIFRMLAYFSNEWNRGAKIGDLSTKTIDVISKPAQKSDSMKVMYEIIDKAGWYSYMHDTTLHKDDWEKSTKRNGRLSIDMSKQNK